MKKGITCIRSALPGTRKPASIWHPPSAGPPLDNNRRKIELLNSLALRPLPGTPVIYYGDEIGMGDNFYLGDRDGVRTPMQWSPDPQCGLLRRQSAETLSTPYPDPEYHYESVNTETQRSNTVPLFWYMKRLIAVRKKLKTFGRGDMKFLNVENRKGKWASPAAMKTKPC